MSLFIYKCNNVFLTTNPLRRQPFRFNHILTSSRLTQKVKWFINLWYRFDSQLLLKKGWKQPSVVTIGYNDFLLSYKTSTSKKQFVGLFFSLFILLLSPYKAKSHHQIFVYLLKKCLVCKIVLCEEFGERCI